LGSDSITFGFLGYELDEKIPDHSVLSKARARWGKEVFENLFVRTVAQCVEAGLVDGSKLHVDASLIDADAARESVIKGAPPLIAALKDRVIDDREGVITATETTPGSIAENKKLLRLIDQHEDNTRHQAQMVIADHKYGTTENYVACQERGITTHMGDALSKAQPGCKKTIFGDERLAMTQHATFTSVHPARA
jgi:hypothetical protein